MDKKQVLFFDTFKEIVSIFAETEIGSGIEVNVDAIVDYLNEFKFRVDTWDYNSKEELEQYITDEILNGMPVWRFLNVSDWTKDMIEKSFTEECKEEYKQMQKEYCCLTCKYYKAEEISIGLFQKCTRPKEKTLGRREEFKLHKRCKYYENIN